MGLAAAVAGAALGAAAAQAETRVTLKSAKADSSYYQMMVQLSEALRNGTDGEIIATVEESQGSVQNVMEAMRRPGNYVFTTPPSLIAGALEGGEPFPANPAFAEIRSLFSIPYLTMHWVVRADSGVETFADLAGESFIPGGTGSFGQRQTVKVFEALGIADEVDMVDVELNAAVPAVQNGRVAGFATAGSHPAPNVMELAAGTDIRLLSLSDEDLAKLGQGEVIEIPAGTYAGVDQPTRTLSLPVGVYATTNMDDDTAYAITRAFWEQRDQLADSNRWWAAITPDTIATLGTTLHPGALRYYEEAGIAVPDRLR
ncbi:MAG TPA: TAXI family TRAP transporter solute-binding subunit [Alphaproteobacteria bacterium]|nr:TAXI family TRAP transporter solute-binding subunit [Alphaproteobacteria bacterium]